MPLYDVKKIQVSSILKVSTIISAVSGALFCFPYVYTFSPSLFLADLGLLYWVGYWIGFVIGYTFVSVVVAIIMAWLYNFVVSKLNIGVVISLEPKE